MTNEDINEDENNDKFNLTNFSDLDLTQALNADTRRITRARRKNIQKRVKKENRKLAREKRRQDEKEEKPRNNKRRRKKASEVAAMNAAAAAEKLRIEEEEKVKKPTARQRVNPLIFCREGLLIVLQRDFL